MLKQNYLKKIIITLILSNVILHESLWGSKFSELYIDKGLDVSTKIGQEYLNALVMKTDDLKDPIKLTEGEIKDISVATMIAGFASKMPSDARGMIYANPEAMGDIYKLAKDKIKNTIIGTVEKGEVLKGGLKLFKGALSGAIKGAAVDTIKNHYGADTYTGQYGAYAVELADVAYQSKGNLPVAVVEMTMLSANKVIDLKKAMNELDKAVKRNEEAANGPNYDLISILRKRYKISNTKEEKESIMQRIKSELNKGKLTQNFKDNYVKKLIYHDQVGKNLVLNKLIEKAIKNGNTYYVAKIKEYINNNFSKTEAQEKLKNLNNINLKTPNQKNPISAVKNKKYFKKNHTSSINIHNSKIISNTKIHKKVNIKNSNLGNKIKGKNISIKNSKLITNTNINNNAKIQNVNLGNKITGKNISIKNSKIITTTTITGKTTITNSNLGTTINGKAKNIRSSSNVKITGKSKINNSNLGISIE